MASETVQVLHETGKTVWLAVFNSSGQVWDFTAETFRALGSAANFSKSMAAVSGATYAYSTTIDLSTLNAAAAVSEFSVVVYEQAGGSASLSADTPLESSSIAVHSGSKYQPGPIIEPVVEVTIDGSDVEISAWLEADGVLVDLDTVDSSATCDVQVREHSAGAVLFQVDDADDAGFALSANVANHFELTKSSVITSGLDDSSMFVRVTIVENSNTHTRDYPASVFGGS